MNVPHCCPGCGMEVFCLDNANLSAEVTRLRVIYDAACSRAESASDRADAYLSELKALREKPNENAKNVAECWIHIEEMCAIESREEREERYPGQALSMAVFAALSKRDTKAEAERDALAGLVMEADRQGWLEGADELRPVVIELINAARRALEEARDDE